MSKSVRISEDLHEFIVAHNRQGETMEETLRRLIGGPHPEVVAGILSPETVDEVRERLEAKRERDAVDNRSLRKRFE